MLNGLNNYNSQLSGTILWAKRPKFRRGEGLRKIGTIKRKQNNTLFSETVLRQDVMGEYARETLAKLK